MLEGMAEWGNELFLLRERDRRRGPAAENYAGNDVVRRGFEPCLLTLLRLSVDTESRIDVISGWLPRALARTGYLDRAAELAFRNSGERKQGDALIALVQTAASTGDLVGAQALAESIPAPQLRDQALVDLVPAWASAGEHDRAVALAESIRFPHNWAWVWAKLAKALADNGDTDGALRYAARADDEVRAYVYEGTGQVLILLMEVAVACGDHVRAAEFAERVENISRSHNRRPWSRCGPLAAVLASEALRGNLDRIDALTADDMACVLDAVAETADQDVALALADRAEALLEISPTDALLSAVTLLLARHGQVERAMSLADWLDGGRRVGRHAEIVGELARFGDTAAAEALAYTIDDSRARDRALINVVWELAGRGDTDAAETLARTITDDWARGEALVAVVPEVARGGDPDRAEALAHTITYRATRARALAALVEVSEPSHARRLAAQVVVLSGWRAVLSELEQIAPRAVAVVVDEMLSNHNADCERHP